MSCLTGDVPRVNGQLAVSRAFGDKSLKSYLRSDPDIQNTKVDGNTDVLVLASDGLWKVNSFGFDASVHLYYSLCAHARNCLNDA